MAQRIKNNSVEFYRIVATIVICAHHFRKEPSAYNILGVFVEFFFILSGYYLCVSISREENHDCVAFGRKRLLRLYPEYLVSYALLILATFIFDRKMLIRDVAMELSLQILNLPVFSHISRFCYAAFLNQALVIRVTRYFFTENTLISWVAYYTILIVLFIGVHLLVQIWHKRCTIRKSV